MVGFKRYWGLPALVAVGLAIPGGVSNLFLPSTLASSVFDGSRVYVPVVSVQTLLLVVYCLIHLRLIRLTPQQLVMAVVLIFITLMCSCYSLYPSGFLSYSTTWLIAPFAVTIHYKKMRNATIDPFSSTVGMVAYFFIPFYVVDLCVSLHTFGFEEFTSYTLATNGHTFVSMLLFLFVQFDLIAKPGRFRVIGFEMFALLVYLVGGVISQGRVALAFMFLATMGIHWKHARKVVPAGGVGLLALIFLSDKFNVIFNALVAADFEDPVVWSSLLSRLNFWNVFFDIFASYPFAGAGGLSANIIKYDYDFPYDVFVDPHNEFIFILSGFGMCGFAFVAVAIILCRSMRKRQLSAPGIQLPLVRPAIVPTALFYIAGCSLTNANSAKQNIELLLCLTILLALTGAMRPKKEE